MMGVGQKTPTNDVEDAFATMTRAHIEAFISPLDPVFALTQQRIVDLALAHRLPGMHWVREFVDAGGLMSYGPSLPSIYRRAAVYVDKLLKGAKPADLPVEQPTKFHIPSHFVVTPRVLHNCLDISAGYPHRVSSACET